MSFFGSIILVSIALIVLRRSTAMRVGSAIFAFAVFTTILLLVFYYLVNSFTGSGVDESVLYFVRTGFKGAALREFSNTISIMVVLIVIALLISLYTYRSVRVEISSWKSRLRALIGASALIGSFYVNPALTDILSLTLAARSSSQIELVLGETPELFVSVDTTRFESNRKNLVLLYLESVERTFLDEELFPGLTPNLAAFEKEALSFTDITQVSGSSHTIAGIVSSQCGFPLFVSTGSGADQFLPGAKCVGDILNESGYALGFVGGAQLEFAGKGIFYKTHGFQSVEGRDELVPTLNDPEYLSYWGLYDDSLLEIGMNRFDSMSSGADPYGLVLLTVDTHHPSGGHTASTCNDHEYQDGDNEYLNSIHCVDFLASEFIQHVKTSSGFENTVFVILSDHMARPNQATDILERGERRNLFMVFGEGIETGEISKPGNTLDIAPTLLKLLGADTKALGYGRSLLEPEPTLRSGPIPVDDVTNEGRSFLSDLWSHPQLNDGFTLDSAKEFLHLGNRVSEFPALFQLDEDLNVKEVNYETTNGTRLVSSVISLWFERRFVWVDYCNRSAIFVPDLPPDPEQICMVAGSLGSPYISGIVLSNGQSVKFGEIQSYFEGAPARQGYYDLRITNWRRDLQLVDSEVVKYTPPSGLVGDVAIRSAGFPNRNSWVIDRMTGAKVELRRGLTLIGFNSGSVPVKLAHKDTCGYSGERFGIGMDGTFFTEIERYSGIYGAFVIVGDSSVKCTGIDPRLRELFAGTDFTRWSELSYNDPYVAILSGFGEVQEFVGKGKTALGIELTNFIKPVTITQRQSLWLPRVAHAGGNYQGMRRTNSFEALEASAPYHDLIELDFSWTADGHLVCLHDWKKGFIKNEGQPLTLAEFEVRNEANPAFNSCTLGTLTEWMRIHDGFKIVMDVKGDVVDAYSFLSETYPDLQNRFVPQIYQPEDYKTVRELGYEDIIWTLYRYDGSIQKALSWLKHMDLLGLSIEMDWVELGMAREAREQTGVLSWVSTINTIEEYDALVQAGVAEIYSDYLLPKNVERFLFLSSGFGTGATSVRNIDHGGSVSLYRGSSVVGLSADSEPEILARYDGCEEDETSSTAKPSAVLDALKEQRESYDALAVIVHDSAYCKREELGTILADSGLAGWAAVGFREPYIGLLHRDGRVLEFSGVRQTVLREVLPIEIGYK